MIWDNGLFCSLAETLSPNFKKTYYFSEYAGPFPRDAETAIGQGLPGVTRVFDPWTEVLSEGKEDLLVVFPDCFYGGLQEFLRSLGYRVWGSGTGERIELDRLFAHRLFEQLGVPTPKWEHITGTAKLKDYLKANPGVYVKTRYGRIRGSGETHKVESYDLAEPWFDEMEKNLGRRKAMTEFIVEHPTPDAMEISSERFLVDRQFPGVSMFSMEVKGDGAVSKVLATERFPTQITEVDRVLIAEPWADGYRQQWTIETRVDKTGKPWPIDPCTRFGRPSWGTVSANTTNLADILWSGAEGLCVDPEPVEEYVAELMIECPLVATRGCVLDVPSSVAPYVFLSDSYIQAGKRCVAAMDIQNIGSVVGIGSSLDAAIDQCKKRSEKIKADGIEMHVEAFDKATENWESLSDYGVDV